MGRLVRGALRRRAEAFALRDARRRLRNESFSIVSDDCWGGEIYRLTGAKVMSPFVGLGVPMPCFLKILRDLPRAMASDLVQIDTSRYDEVERSRERLGPFPMGLLADVDAEILFLHYPSWDVAYRRWMRRRERVDLANPFVKLTRHPNRLHELQEEFARLPYQRKVVVSEARVPSVNTWIAPFSEDAVARLHRGAVHFDHIDWLNGGTGQVSTVRRLGRIVKYGGWP
jgi:uncharacterized protein (DUF1919 family)